MIDQKKIAVIHIVKDELGLEDAEYRKILREVAGVDTSKNLDEIGFRKLMNYFVRSRYYKVNSHGLTFRQKMYIKYLVQGMSWGPNHLANFLRKYYGKTRIDDLTKQEGIKVIESLKKVIQHSSKPRDPYEGRRE